MQILLISNNHNTKQLSFEAGKIKVMNPKAWTDAELKAFIQNNEFKNLANKLKKKNLDLFVSINKTQDKSDNTELNLFSGKNDKPEILIQKINGPIWNCTPEKRSLIDNIVLFPNKIENLFYKKTQDFEKEKNHIAKELKKKNIIIRDLDYWHISELKALKDNPNFIKLTNRPDLKGTELHFVREFSDYLNCNYIEVCSGCSLIGTILPRNCEYNGSSSITDAIAKFKDFIPLSAEKTKEDALADIENFNKKHD